MAGFMLSLFLRLREQKNGGAGVGGASKGPERWFVRLGASAGSDWALRLVQSGARGLSIGSQG